MTYIEQVNQLTRQYNDAIHALENSYNMESIQEGWYLSSSHLSKQYAKKYDVLVREYRQKSHQLLHSYQQSHPQWAKERKLWGWGFFVGILLLMGSCMNHLSAAAVEDSEDTANSTVSAALENTTEEKYWSAADVPIPFLQDSTQYVSNPDYVLSQNTVDSMNVTLKILDNKLNIQSVVVVVNHILNDDPFRMAQDLGNKYGVGHANRGLVIVVGYLDHSINISPGRGLEADLTDIECNHLEQKYVIPAMRAEMPDSAMLYLTEGLYALMAKKEMPTMSLYDESAEDGTMTTLGIHLLLFIAWCVFFLRLNRKYFWMALTGAVSLLPNPFYVPSSSSGGFGGGGFGGHSSGGGFSGGSFGGGSFGGGGATSRW